MWIFNKPVALHYGTKELSLTKQVKSMIHTIVSQGIMITVLELIAMRTVEGVTDCKLPLSISQMGITITMCCHPQMEVVTVVTMMVKDCLGIVTVPDTLAVIEENVLPIEVGHPIDNTMMGIALHHHLPLLTDHHCQKAQMMIPMIIEIIG
jgi:hypothetical protein